MLAKFRAAQVCIPFLPCPQSAEVPAAHLDGSMPHEERQRLLEALSAGDIQVLCSVGVLSEGFDEPRLGAVLLARPTSSRALYLQQVGRGLRSCRDMDKCCCIVLDMSCNTVRHGCIVGGGGAFEKGMWRGFLTPGQAPEAAQTTAALRAEDLQAVLEDMAAGHFEFSDLPPVVQLPAAAAPKRSRKARLLAGVVMCLNKACARLQHGSLGKCQGCSCETVPVQAPAPAETRALPQCATAPRGPKEKQPQSAAGAAKNCAGSTRPKQPLVRPPLAARALNVSTLPPVPIRQKQMTHVHCEQSKLEPKGGATPIQSARMSGSRDDKGARTTDSHAARKARRAASEPSNKGRKTRGRWQRSKGRPKAAADRAPQSEGAAPHGKHASTLPVGQ